MSTSPPGGGVPPPPGPTPGTGGASATPPITPGLQIVGPTPAGPEPVLGWVNTFAGRNDKAKAHQLGPYEAAVIENLFLDTLTLKLRSGKAVIMDSLNTATPYEAHGGTRVYQLTGAPFDYVAGTMNGVNLVRSNRTGAWATIISAYADAGTDLRVEFVHASSAVYVLFGSTTENARKITGADSVANAAWASAAPNIRPSMGVFHKKRLWLDDVSRKGTVWFSNNDAPDTMLDQTSATIATEGGRINLLIPDGDKVTGMESFGGNLIVFSERSVSVISGSNFANLVITTAWGFGTKSPRSVRVADNDLWFLDSSGKVRFISSSQANINATIAVGFPGWYVEPLTTAISQTNLQRVSAVYFDRKYWLFYPTGNVLVWDFREFPFPGSRWVSLTNFNVGHAWTVGSGADADGIRYLDSAIARLRQYPSGTTDDGTAIPFKWKSRAFSWWGPLWEGTIDYVAPTCHGFTGTTTVDVFTDLSATSASTTALTYAAGTFERQSTQRLASTVQGRVLQVQLSGSSSTGWECGGVEVIPARKRRP